MIITYNYKNYYINKIHLFKDGQIILSFENEVAFTDKRIDNTVYKCNLKIDNKVIDDLKKKNKLDLNVKNNFIYKTLEEATTDQNYINKYFSFKCEVISL